MAFEETKDETGKAIAYLLMGITGGLGLDLCAKEILQTYSLEQFVFLRSLIGVAIFLLLARQFGGVESLVEHRYSIEGEGSPVPKDWIRLSIGIESVDDLITDFEQALVKNAS